jgi:hypothetical protein
MRRQAREPIDLPAETRELLQAGKLEQMCGACGRWEAAHWSCSWCGSPTGPADWYRNGDREQREARMPKTAPANPPSEYRDASAKWPSAWGTYPGQTRPKAPRLLQTPVNRGQDEILAPVPTPPEQLSFAASSALSGSSPSGPLSGAESPASIPSP